MSKKISLREKKKAQKYGNADLVGRKRGTSLEEVEHKQPSWLSKVCCVHSLFLCFRNDESWKRGNSEKQ